MFSGGEDVADERENPYNPDDDPNLTGGDLGTPTELDDTLDDLGGEGSIAGETFLDNEFVEEADDAFAGLHLPEDEMHVETIDDLRRESESNVGASGWDGDLYDSEGPDDVVADARRRLTVAQLMQRLVHDADDVALRDLFVLSDLTREEMATVETHWNEVPVMRRRRLVEWLVDAAADHMELLLGRLLRVALRDEDARVRTLSISGLWEDAEPDLIGPLTTILRSDPAESVRAAAASALGAFILAGELDELDASLAMRAEQALLAAYQSGEEAVTVQARALESLAYSGEAGLRQMIEDAYYASHEEMRLSAVRAMGRSADIRWRALARAELASPDAEMRAEAARAVGELDAKAVVPDLIQLLEDSAQSVRHAAIEALGRLGGRDARDALREVANGGDEDDAAAAEDALEEMLFLDEVGDTSLFDEEADEDEADDFDADADYYQRSRQRRDQESGHRNGSQQDAHDGGASSADEDL